MSVQLTRSRRRSRTSVTRRDLVPDLGVAAGSVALAVALHWLLVRALGDNPPLIVFAATAAGLTFWRGLGPGILASALGSTVGGTLFLQPVGQLAAASGGLPVGSSLLFAESLFVCWLIYRLKDENESAVEVHARRDDALAFVSHELRHPLSNIQLAASMLQRDRSDQTRDRATQLIARSATRLGRVIDDLIDVTRLKADAITVEPTDVVLQDVIVAAVEATSPAIANRQQFLDVDLSLIPQLRIQGDAVRLQQVFGNLLSNASRYSPEGAEISVSARAEEGQAVVVVRDTGVGIRREMLDRIFEPFVREANGTTEGLGIGLTLARTVVERHGGRVMADSDGPGRGSAFSVVLPMGAS
jgi:signal transduction histidine kinase